MVDNYYSAGRVTVVGHPFAPLGMGQQVRACFRSFRAVGAAPKLLDIYGYNDRNDEDFEREFAAHMTDGLSSELNIFHINGDEVAPVLNHLNDANFEKAYNIVCPAWELEEYPDVWARELERFDEIWAPSSFVTKSIAAKTETPVSTVPIAVEPKCSSFIGRRALGLPEHLFTYLFFFDFSSYATRKNPLAVLDAFNTLVDSHPKGRLNLVLKHKGTGGAANLEAQYLKAISRHSDQITIIERTLSSNETYNLVRNADCFVSMHRSEGFGLGLAEAMALGTPVVATGWSGNLDFMRQENSWLVEHDFVNLGVNDYPHGEGQSWAEPHVEHAVALMREVWKDREGARKKVRRAQLDIRTHQSHRAIGLKYISKLKNRVSAPNMVSVS